MALDLTLQITADAAQAKAELRAVEDGIKKVDNAAQKSSTSQTAWWQKEEQAIGKVSGALTDQHQTLSKTEQAFNKLEGAVGAAERSAVKLGGSSVQTTSALSGLAGGTGNLSTALMDMVGASDLSVAALAGIAGAAGLVLGVVAAMGAMIVSATIGYIEHAKSADHLRSKIEELTKRWGDWQDALGGAVVGDQSAFDQIFSAATGVLDEYMFKLVSATALTRQLFGLMAGPTTGVLPDPSQVLGGKHPLGSNFSFVESGAGAIQFPSGDTAMQLFQQDEAERQKRAQEAKRAADARQRELDAIQRAYNNGPSYRLGVSGQVGGYVPAPTAPFDPSGMLHYQLGMHGSMPEAVSVETMLAGVLKKPGFSERLMGSLVPNLGRVFEGLLVQGGGTGGAIGGSIGSSLFGSMMGGDTGKSITSALTGSLGKTLGGAVGSFIPFGGQILGSLIGKMFGGLFSETQGHKDLMAGNQQIGDMKAALGTQYGSSGGAQNAGSIFGVDLAGAWSSQNLAGAEHFKALMGELAQKQASFNNDLGGTLGKIKDLGGGIPAALEPYLKSLEDAKVLTQDNIDLIASMAGDAVPSFEAMEQAAARLGISTDNLGQSFHNAKAAANWQSVIDDLDTLIRGSADMNTLLGDEGLQAKFNELVQQSMQFGTTIPDNMKPWIQKLIDAGKLVGVTGEKITDISTLNFGETMQTSLEKLNDTLEKLIETLSVRLPAAARDGSRKAGEALDTLPIPGRGGSGGSGDSGGGSGDGGGASAPAMAVPVTIRLGSRAVWEGMIDVAHSEGAS